MTEPSYTADEAITDFQDIVNFVDEREGSITLTPLGDTIMLDLTCNGYQVTIEENDFQSCVAALYKRMRSEGKIA